LEKREFLKCTKFLEKHQKSKGFGKAQKVQFLEKPQEAPSFWKSVKSTKVFGKAQKVQSFWKSAKAQSCGKELGFRKSADFCKAHFKKCAICK
jgi:hypothetical protein